MQWLRTLCVVDPWGPCSPCGTEGSIIFSELCFCCSQGNKAWNAGIIMESLIVALDILYGKLWLTLSFLWSLVPTLINRPLSLNGAFPGPSLILALLWFHWCFEVAAARLEHFWGLLRKCGSRQTSLPYIYLRLKKYLNFYKISFKLGPYKKLVFLSYVQIVQYSPLCLLC